MTAQPGSVEPTVLPEFVGTWLRDPDVDLVAAQMFIDAAMLACRAVVNPIPTAAGPIVTAVAARAYVNPGARTTRAEGPWTEGFGTKVGIYVSDSEREQLLSLTDSGTGGGAFTIDPTPVTAGVPVQSWPYSIDGQGW